MKKVGIIGFGRFGELLAHLCATEFDVHIVESDTIKTNGAANAGYKCIDFNDLKNVDYIFLAVPISAIENILIQLAPLVSEQQVVIDICSVKVHPVNLMKKYLKSSQILGTHPMFGPDSAKKGLHGLQIAICPIAIEPKNLKIIKDFWVSKGIIAIETTPENHDKDAAYSLAFTHTIAKIIVGMNMPDIKFKTRSFNDITEIASLTARDTDQLFHDILFYNSYFPHMKKDLEESFKKTYSLLNSIEAEQSLLQT